MILSYRWLGEYFPREFTVPPAEELARVLTSVGLEVESLESYQSVKGALAGLVVGEVIACNPHPRADKLWLTQIFLGPSTQLDIVCGASNVAKGQKVVVAPPGTTLFPYGAEPFQIQNRIIRGETSQGMLCAADEIGLGADHSGILVLPNEAVPGNPVTDYIPVYTDRRFHIGLTPNHMDAMSHLGVARDLCAFYSHQQGKTYAVRWPELPPLQSPTGSLPFRVRIENSRDCRRYSAIVMDGIRVAPSPQWLQDRLSAVGVRPINNIVDITNFVLGELGQPLHAFDGGRLRRGEIRVKNLPEGTPFVTLDGKERKLSAEDLMVCDGEVPICMAGVFGGLNSGIAEQTERVLLESAWFSPQSVRRTAFRHGLRTEAANHFEKGMDISGTVKALERTCSLIRELAGGHISSGLTDEYPGREDQKKVSLRWDYLQRLSGKSYTPGQVQGILEGLGFHVLDQGFEQIRVAAPYHKPDISIPADLVEEVMRIDGLDSVPIPSRIRISPSVEASAQRFASREKLAGWLAGQGFQEILTNSITNSAYFEEPDLVHAVRLINNLSSELNILRPRMLETGLEAIAYNLNRKATELKFFEFGKTYEDKGTGEYPETLHLALYVSGRAGASSWRIHPVAADLYYLKGICQGILRLLNIAQPQFGTSPSNWLNPNFSFRLSNQLLMEAGQAPERLLRRFSIRQPVLFADFHAELLLGESLRRKIEFQELPRQMLVSRDLALVLDKGISYREVEQTIQGAGIDKLLGLQLFDIFESEKWGASKKSLAVSLEFIDQEKTLTDKEVDAMMQSIRENLEKKLGAEIRK
jgi:phenylalanyl-tRNA synthetase beta chain